MAALLLQVGSLDLTDHIRAQPDEGLAPDGGGTFLENQFAGSLAFNEGQVSIGESAGNRQFAAPLYLNATTTDGCLQLLQQLREACVQGAQVQFRPDGASNISYFDLEAADIRPQYSHHHLRSGWLKVNLVLHTRPYAHTGTTRVVATAQSTGPLTMHAAAVAGDTPATLDTYVAIGSQGVADRRVIAIGAYPHPSYPALRAGASAQPGVSATVFGASGAIASKYLAAQAVGDVTASGAWLDKVALGPDFAGRHRVFGVVRSNIFPASAGAFVLYNHEKQSYSPTAYVSYAQSPNTTWEIIDLGEVNVAGGGTLVPTVELSLRFGANTGSRFASYGVNYAGMVFVPLDGGAQVLVATTPNVSGRDRGHDYISLGATPGNRTVRVGSASGAATQTLDMGPFTRGNPPTLQPSGPAAPSGPHTIVVFQGGKADYLASDVTTVTIRARERWSFFR